MLQFASLVPLIALANTLDWLAVIYQVIAFATCVHKFANHVFSCPWAIVHWFVRDPVVRCCRMWLLAGVIPLTTFCTADFSRWKGNNWILLLPCYT